MSNDSSRGITNLVLDFTEDFWQITIAPEEQRFFTATAILGGQRKFIAFLRAAQGSRAAPLLWARVAALVMRLTQSLFSPEDFRLMCFVDDPLAVIAGTPWERKVRAAMVILVWEALKFKLAYQKGQLDTGVTWIGGTLTAELAFERELRMPSFWTSRCI